MSAVLKGFPAVALAAIAGWSSSADAQTTVRYVHTDALGSVVAKTDENRVVVERREYEPYGQQLTALEDGPGYTGHVQDAATGLTYMQQRYYDPSLGLFLSVDPVVGDANKLRHFNRYYYAYANPYFFSDPDGRLPAPGSIGKAWTSLVRLVTGDTVPPPPPPSESQAATHVAEVADQALDQTVGAAVTNAVTLGGTVDVVASAASGPVGGSTNLGTGETSISVTPVATGREASLMVSLKEPLIEWSFVDNPVEAPVSMTFDASGCANSMCVGATIEYNPGGTISINPAIGPGSGFRAVYTPTINFDVD